jgi:adenylate kinase family enzyme
MINKVLILGPIASGKSTLSVHLGKYLGLPVYHLDNLFWEPNWEIPSSEKWDRKKRWLFEKEQWIMDGNYINSLPDRLKLADLVIYIDCPTYICVIRALRRFYGEDGSKYLAKGCGNSLSLNFMKKILFFNKLGRVVKCRY